MLLSKVLKSEITESTELFKLKVIFLFLGDKAIILLILALLAASIPDKESSNTIYQSNFNIDKMLY